MAFNFTIDIYLLPSDTDSDDSVCLVRVYRSE